MHCPSAPHWVGIVALALTLLRCSSEDAESTSAGADHPEADHPEAAHPESDDPESDDPESVASADSGTEAAPGAPVGEPLPGVEEEGLRPGDVELIDPGEPTEAVEPSAPGAGELTTPLPPSVPPALDCGPDGWAVENAGPPRNRVNYVILADGYGANGVDTTLEEHIQRALDRRFNHESGEPYGRYRKFVNICVMKVVSASDGIGNGPTAFDGGNGGDRLARVNAQKVNAYLDRNLPETLEVDWRAVVLNQDLWENTGAQTMLWSGGNQSAPGAALHEGGHGFHQLADEYCQSGTGARCGPNEPGPTGNEFAEVNSSGDPVGTRGKWDVWLGTVQRGLKVPDQGATGLQGVFSGSRYVDTGQYRPSSNSMMNSLFGNDVDTSFNSVSREQMIFSIWRVVRPIDATEPPAGEVDDPSSLSVSVVDPAVISIDWEIDGELVAEKAGGKLDMSVAALASGSHVIRARAYDNASEDLVRQRSGTCPDAVTGRYCHATDWLNSTETVEWTVHVP
jgi:hypothetical protein